MDSRSVYTVSVLPPDESVNGPDTRGAVQRELVNFILDFHIDNAFIYRFALLVVHFVRMLTYLQRPN